LAAHVARAEDRVVEDSPAAAERRMGRRDMSGEAVYNFGFTTKMVLVAYVNGLLAGGASEDRAAAMALNFLLPLTKEQIAACERVVRAVRVGIGARTHEQGERNAQVETEPEATQATQAEPEELDWKARQGLV
jgi:hypothetical protein